jgi:hypothetical protein
VWSFGPTRRLNSLACKGAHGVFAAQNAELEMVLVDLHSRFELDKLKKEEIGLSTHK